MSTIKEMYCHYFGHDYRYNFATTPSKRICACCKKRQKFIYESLIWVDGMEDQRNDWELIRKWVSEKYLS